MFSNRRNINRKIALKLIKRAYGLLSEKYGITNLWLFGSVARDDPGPHGDVDILVEFRRPIGFFEFVRLQRELEKIFKKRVDLVTPDALKKPIKDRVLKEAIHAGA